MNDTTAERIALALERLANLHELGVPTRRPENDLLVRAHAHLRESDLREAAEKYANWRLPANPGSVKVYVLAAFEAGADWQRERGDA